MFWKSETFNHTNLEYKSFQQEYFSKLNFGTFLKIGRKLSAGPLKINAIYIFWQRNQVIFSHAFKENCAKNTPPSPCLITFSVCIIIFLIGKGTNACLDRYAWEHIDFVNKILVHSKDTKSKRALFYARPDRPFCNLQPQNQIHFM